MPSARDSDLNSAGLGFAARTEKIDFCPDNQIKQLLKQACDSLPLRGVVTLLLDFVGRQEE